VTHDTGYPKERVEEREHATFVPPDEQHRREDGAPIEPAEPAERAQHESGRYDAEASAQTDAETDAGASAQTDAGTEAQTHDADRVEAIGTESVPHPPDTDRDEAQTHDADRVEAIGTESVPHPRDTDRDPEPTLVDPEPATPLDTGTAEDAERADEMEAASEDERADSGEERVDTELAWERHPDLDRFADDVAVGTAPAPQTSTASTAEFWPAGLLDDLRGRWDAVQMRFVDDPASVAADAKALVGEAVSAIRDAVDRLEARLEEAGAEATDDTEELRKRVAHYRDVFESLLSR
jgi:hypothetical protein